MDHKNLRALLIVLTAVTLPIASWGDESAVYEVELAPQPLSDALKSFADQTGLQVMFFSEVTDGVQTSALNGDYTADAALDTLLASSGLTYEYINDKAVTVRAVDTAAESPRGDSDSKNSRPTPVLLTQNRTSEALTAESNRSDVGRAGIVTGKVTDARTGANLKGALVSVQSTGQSTRTDDLGRFRIVGVPAGEQSIAVSFLGYAPDVINLILQSAVASDVSFSLHGGSDVEEIIVYGQRSARALALNQERTAPNSTTVISSDLLGGFGGSTLSDALRRAPGVAFEPNVRTGDGANIILRGLQPDFNQIRLNGLRLGDASGTERAPDIGGILADSIDSITISKTLLPSQESGGTGGLVEIETKSPLDRPKRFARFAVQHEERGTGFGDELLASGAISGSFGKDDDLGASLSIQFRDFESVAVRNFTQLRFGRYLPLDENGAPVSSLSGIDPLRSFPFEPGVTEAFPSGTNISYDTNQIKNLTFTGTLEKQVGDHTNLRVDFTRADVSTDSLNAGIVTTAISNYELLPISSLGGEQRYALVTEDALAGLSPFFAGNLVADRREAFYDKDAEQITEVFSLRGSSEIKNWTVQYEAGISNARSETPRRLDLNAENSVFAQPRLTSSDLIPSIASNTVDGRLISIFQPILPGESARLVLPGYTQDRLDFVNDINNYSFSRARITNAFGENKRRSVNLSARYDFGHDFLKYLAFGFEYERSRSASGVLSISDILLGGSSLSSVGLIPSSGILNRIGIEAFDLHGFTFETIKNFGGNVDALEESGQITVQSAALNERLDDQFTKETEYAYFVEGRFDIGKLEVIGGARISQVDVNTRFDSSPSFEDIDGMVDPTYRERFGQLVDTRDETVEVLPRVLANYRFSENTVLRAGYFTTVARPTISALSDSQSVSLSLRPVFGPNSDRPRLSVFQGNPGLRPSFTHNFDFSVEHFDESVGSIQFAAFYKEIKDPFDIITSFESEGVDVEGLSLPDTPEFNNLPPNLFVTVTQPANQDNNSKIWGIEAEFERQFGGLPGVFGGLGIRTNYTYTDGTRTVTRTSFFAPNGADITKAFTGSPKQSGTLAVTFNQNGFDASIAYTAQDRRLTSVTSADFGLDLYDDVFDSLDFRIEYFGTLKRGASYSLFFEGNDLLKGRSDVAISQSYGGEGGVPRYNAASSTFLGGRSFTFGVSTSF